DNFGNTVAEALAHGTPVIASTHTPWADLRKHHCGWLTETSEDELSAVLRDAIGRNDQARSEMGARGEELVRNRYSLDFTCQCIFDVYQWLLGNSRQPDCVET